MKYFAPITKLEVSLLWGMALPRAWDRIMFIQAKKNGEPIKNGSVYQTFEMNEITYNYKLVKYVPS